MTKDLNISPALRQKLVRSARIIDRAQRWERLAFMSDEEADLLLQEHEDADSEASMDDGSYPAGPRNEKNKSRYQLQPGHGRGLSDLLRTTAEVLAIQKIAKLFND